MSDQQLYDALAASRFSAQIQRRDWDLADVLTVLDALGIDGRLSAGGYARGLDVVHQLLLELAPPRVRFERGADLLPGWERCRLHLLDAVGALRAAA